LNISYWSVSLLFFLVGLAMYVFLWWGLRLFALQFMPGWFFTTPSSAFGLDASGLSFYIDIKRICIWFLTFNSFDTVSLNIIFSAAFLLKNLPLYVFFNLTILRY
jgi:hypothetical protein